MTRMSRIVVPGCPHHVTQRGNHHQRVFFSDADYETYIKLLRKFFGKYSLDLIGYCLMPNHVHLAVVPELESSLAKGVGLLHNDFSRWQHIQQNQNGHLWQNRFYSNAMDDDHCWMALRYIELNPVRAGLVRHPCDWEWSSARAHVTGADEAGILRFEWWARQFNGSSWEEYLLEGSGTSSQLESIRRANRTGRPLGDNDFVRKLEKLTGRELFPKKPGPKPLGTVKRSK